MNLYTVPELKVILESLGMKKNGNKPVLIVRIIDNLDDIVKEQIVEGCNFLFIAEKGEFFLEENYDYILFHRKQYGVSFDEFCKHRILGNRKRQFYDIIFQCLSERTYTYQVKEYFSQLEMIYHNLSELSYDEGNFDSALQYALYRLYFSTNLSSRIYLFSLPNIEFAGINKTKEKINYYETFNRYTVNRIIELKSNYNDHMLDIIYDTPILPYCIFNKEEFSRFIDSLYNSDKFNFEHFNNIIKKNYSNYIKFFIK